MRSPRPDRRRPAPRLVLASASPARLRALQAAGIEPEVVVSGVDESTVADPDPGRLSLQLARLKAGAVAALPRVTTPRPAAEPRRSEPVEPPERVSRTLVLGCDSVLGFDGEVYGKPMDAEDAVARWKRMRGRSGTLHTGHCLIDATFIDASGSTPAVPGRPQAAAVAAADVRFADVSDAEIAAYVATGEPLRVAGGFTIDGLGGPFVAGVNGDPGTVIGLSLPLLRRLLGELGFSIIDLWRR